MDQRRIVLFLALSFAVLVLNSMFLAPQRNAKKLSDKPKDPVAEQVAADKAPVGLPEVPVAPDAQAVPADFPESKESPLSYLTLGSIDSKSPFRLLCTFTNHGAAIQRVELSSSRFRDLQDRSGYLGQLELITDPRGGLLVQVVGAGTPAAKAGIEVGDRLISVNGKEGATKLESIEDLQKALARRKPKSKVQLNVARGDEQPTKVEATLRWRPLEVIRPESENELMRTGKLPEDFPSPPSFQFTMEKIGLSKLAEGEAEIAGLHLLDSNWEIVESDQQSITFRQLLPQQRLEVVKKYRLVPVPADKQYDINYPAYSLTLEIAIRNLGEQATEVAYRLDGPNGLPIEGWWYARKFGRNWGSAGLRDVVGRYFGGDTTEQSPSKIASGDGKDFEGGSMAFMGVDAQYFSSVLLPIKQSPDEVWLDVVRPVLLSPPPKARSNDGTFANVTCRLISKPNIIQPGQSLEQSYTIFAGPKRPALLANYLAVNSPQYSLTDLVYFGWFSTVAKGMLAILHFFYGIVGNYGIAIVMLTVLVRSGMFPISRKQMQSMAKMQQLKPELDKLKEKYKNDSPKQSQAMQELYRKHKINPLAGCLPMFIQLPVFIGLYRSLAVDVELRQAPLFGDAIRWCSNLAAPDMLWNWSSIMPSFISSGEGFFGLGPYLNVLPLVTCGLFILQQKLVMPEPANEQAALQQKMMKYMMVFMGLLFYKVAAGLCIYFIASSAWGIAERKLIPAPVPTGLNVAPSPVNTRTSFSSTKNGAASDKQIRRPKKKR
ncbi:YidC/Oxa1 family insertase periplasmic-domain containing protein [Bythopirellula polymerisocia]|uniref:Membrane protein insertase YidC n=1 Tax=Bythopirellula polymerisocia TaxID=2528003 RepID=A0A5C6C854_9BACT|nr:YidC/Oxa1 family insertase periplasmic-domain containing protein [Bythopirellula polymerisocia]TWU20843.1 Membrane protein insertase YidC [Bythopirellula polymerisocia]